MLQQQAGKEDLTTFLENVFSNVRNDELSCLGSNAGCTH